MKEKTAATNFSKINSPQDLIAYLSNSGKRLTPTKNNGTQYVYHYTKLSNDRVHCTLYTRFQEFGQAPELK